MTAPTLPTSCGSLPPEGALRLRPGGAGSAAPAGGEGASTRVASCGSLPLGRESGALRLRPGPSTGSGQAEAGSAAPAGREGVPAPADPFALSLSKGASAPAASRVELLAAFDELLQPERFKDYGPNGLQVEGKLEIRKIISGVTASLALIEAAVAAQADAIFVHHGLFWRGQDGRVTGWMKRRLALLLAHDINLYAYHLPLDAHPELGNNAQLGLQLGLKAERYFGDNNLGFLGVRDGQCGGFDTAENLAAHLGDVLKRPVTLVGPAQCAIKNIAWCTGGAQGYFEDAIAAGADVFITGEISEPQAHHAREMGVAFIACGHHASERYGAPAVAAHVASQLGIAHSFIDIDNPA